MIALDAAPTLARSVKLRYDRVRDRWVILGPERGWVLNRTAVEILRRFAPGRSLAEIAGDDATVIEFVQALAERGVIVPWRPTP
jgi:pyrroloquinoline quinone biosynthesis protein D